MTIQELNKLSGQDFVAAINSLYENVSWVGERALKGRPFNDSTDLISFIETLLTNASEQDLLILLSSHSDLGERHLLPSTFSASEQNEAGLTSILPRERDRLIENNKKYRDLYGFPFILCAREHTKDSIFESFDKRYGNPREVEIKKALEEVIKIHNLRLRDSFSL